MIDAYEGDLTTLDDRDLDYTTKQFDLDIQRAENDLYMAQSRLKTLYQANGALQGRIVAEKARRAEEQDEIEDTDDEHWEFLHKQFPERFDADGIYHPPLRATIGLARMSIITDIVWNEFSEEGNGLAGYVEHYRGTEGRQAKMDLIEIMAKNTLSCGSPLIFIDRHVNENMGHEDNTWCGISEHFTEECEDSPVGFKIVNMDYKNPVTGELIDVWDSLKARLWTQEVA